jgi:hypothetical protein
MIAMLYLIGRRDIEVSADAIPAYYFVDGVFSNLFAYPENVTDWLRWLRMDDGLQYNPLYRLFRQRDHSIFEQISKMKDFFNSRDSFNQPKRRGDKIKLSDTAGNPSTHVVEERGRYRFEDEFKSKVIGFQDLLAECCDLQGRPFTLPTENLKLTRFKKDSFQARGWTLTKKNFESFLDSNPFSWAITSTDNIEFTTELNL